METTAWMIFFVLVGCTVLLKNENPLSEEEIVFAEAERIIKQNCLFDYNPEIHREQLKKVLENGNGDRIRGNFDQWCSHWSKEEWLKKTLADGKEAQSEIRAEKIGDILYIAVKGFKSKLTVGDFRSAMCRAGDEDSVIIDLRNNRGGLADVVLEIAAFFGKRPEDILITKKFKNKEEIVRNTDISKEIGLFSKYRLAILVDEWSASAAEIFAGVLKEWKFPIVGKTTYGKGVGQYPFLLPDISILYLTTFEYLVGKNQTQVNKKGVEPDYPATDSRKLFPGLTATPKDRQFMKAVEVLQNME